MPMDASELLDVDVDQLARPLALITGGTPRVRAL
jgi:hypothetical protein